MLCEANVSTVVVVDGHRVVVFVWDRPDDLQVVNYDLGDVQTDVGTDKQHCSKCIKKLSIRCFFSGFHLFFTLKVTLLITVVSHNIKVCIIRFHERSINFFM